MVICFGCNSSENNSLSLSEGIDSPEWWRNVEQDWHCFASPSSLKLFERFEYEQPCMHTTAQAMMLSRLAPAVV